MIRSFARSRRFASLPALLGASVLALPLVAFADEPSKGPAAENPTLESPEATGKESEEKTEFVRLRKTEGGDPIALETAVVRYVKQDVGAKIVVDLIGAVHIGEKAYYDRLNETFEDYETLLYELVAPPDSKVPEKSRGPSLSVIGAGQQGMQNLLGLEFQLEGIDYGKANFVHADMSPAEFDQSMKDRGESWSKMYFRSVGFGAVQQSQNDATGFGMLAALFSSNRELQLKRAFAEQLGDMRMAVGALGGKEGSTILTERNRVALEKLDEILKDGDRVVGVFYGAAHLPDMEERLLARGFVRDQTTWMEAWDLRDPKDSSKEKSADEAPKENAENASEEAAK